MKNVIFGVNLLGSSIYQVLRHRVLRVLVLKMLQLKKKFDDRYVRSYCACHIFCRLKNTKT